MPRMHSLVPATCIQTLWLRMSRYQAHPGLTLPGGSVPTSGRKTAGIIILSGHASPAAEQRASDAGCDRYLVKPFLPDALALEIHDVLNSRHQAKLREQQL